MLVREAAALALLALVASCGRTPPAPAPPSVDGIWLGTLPTGGSGLRLQFRLDLANPRASCFLDSVDQGVFDIPCTAAVTAAALSIDVPSMRGTLVGTVSGDGKAMEATWSLGQPLRLELRRQPSAIPAGKTDDVSPAELAARKLDDAHRKALVEEIARAIQDHYVLPDMGRKTIAALREHAAHGDYDAVTDSETFVDDVTDDLYAASHDKHFACIFGHGGPPALAQLRSTTFGFGTVERLAGNVARLQIWSFPELDDAESEGVADALTRVADADALLVDLRENRGGDPSTVLLIASYLFDRPVHLNDIKWARGDLQAFWTRQDVKGSRFGGKKPVYVLTSHATLSGGEELAYDLQAIHRAVVIGEITSGAAHPAQLFDLDEWFHLFVPVGRAVNPVTGTDWEGVGVQPDVPVSADAALDEALRRASADLAARRPSAGTK